MQLVDVIIDTSESGSYTRTDGRTRRLHAFPNINCIKARRESVTIDKARGESVTRERHNDSEMSDARGQSVSTRDKARGESVTILSVCTCASVGGGGCTQVRGACGCGSETDLPTYRISVAFMH